jgi:hypothetical protein
MDISNQDLMRMLHTAQSMQGKSQDELIRELAGIIKSGQGGITPGKAENMIRAIQPMLEPSQKRMLDKLLKELRGS